MAKHLGLSDDRDVYDVVNAFSSTADHPFFGHVKDYANDPCTGAAAAAAAAAGRGGQLLPLDSVCGRAKEAGCVDYCKMVNSSRRVQAELRELYEMTLDATGPLVPGKPDSLLPVCRYGDGGDSAKFTQGCWRKVVNDHGVCYASITGAVKTFPASLRQGLPTQELQSKSGSQESKSGSQESKSGWGSTLRFPGSL